MKNKRPKFQIIANVSEDIIKNDPLYKRGFADAIEQQESIIRKAIYAGAMFGIRKNAICQNDIDDLWGRLKNNEIG